jgi:glucokinase
MIDGNQLNDGTSACALADDAHSETMPLGNGSAGSNMREIVLAADVGGTNARLGLIALSSDAATLEVLAYQVYPCRDYESLHAIVHRFRETQAMMPRRFALACAGYLHEGRVVNSHLHWPVEPAALERALGLDEVSVLNDFVALAHAVPHLAGDAATTLHAPARGAQTGPVVVVGPGTGLGVAVRLPGSAPQVLPTEAGHIQLAARTARERQVLAVLAPADEHVPYDSALSGPGLLRTYRALCQIEQVSPQWHAPAEVVAAARANNDALAHETLQLFCGWLGSFTGDLAMMYGATGGVHLAGGFLAGMTDMLVASSFLQRFLDKGVVRPFLETVPVQVVDHAQLGVIGAARWLLERPAPGTAA